MSTFASCLGLRLGLRTVLFFLCLVLSACGEETPRDEPTRSSSGAAGTAGSEGSSGAAATTTGGAPSLGQGGMGGGGLWSGGTANEGPGGSGGGNLGGRGGNGGVGGSNLGGTAGAAIGGSAGAPNGGATTQQPITIWIAGDSTVMTYEPGNTRGNNGASLEGWGQELAPFFNGKVTINNQAIGGRSVAMFMWTVATDSAGAQQCSDNQGTPQFKLNNGEKIDTSQWSNVKAGIKPGDFLLIQFGHNDETHTCPRFVNTTDYATYLGFMADTVIAKGATPVFVTPMGHRSFSGAKFNNTLLPYAQSMKGAAQLESLQVIDLNLRSGEYYEKVGTDFLASNIFDGGSTHFVKAGAVQMASLIVGEIEKEGGRLATYLK
jgi:lysophospholipase L1-like esterase